MEKYVFVTGGVISGLGKGITAASLGRLLKARGYKVTMQKFDPYLNVDPGTMSPIQHGEVFVTDDGTETDLDLGHYERFIDENLDKNSNVTTGKIYEEVLAKERHGDYGGGTVQVIPHVTNTIKSKFHRNYKADETEITIVEIGGTIGDIESQPFFEAIRQFILASPESFYPAVADNAIGCTARVVGEGIRLASRIIARRTGSDHRLAVPVGVLDDIEELDRIALRPVDKPPACALRLCIRAHRDNRLIALPCLTRHGLVVV